VAIPSDLYYTLVDEVRRATNITASVYKYIESLSTYGKGNYEE